MKPSDSQRALFEQVHQAITAGGGEVDVTHRLPRSTMRAPIVHLVKLGATADGDKKTISRTTRQDRDPDATITVALDGDNLSTSYASSPTSEGDFYDKGDNVQIDLDGIAKTAREAGLLK